MRPEMKTRGYAVEITNLSPNATEKDVRDFLAFCGSIQHVELVRAGDSACIAYVTFKNPHAAETAVLLSPERHKAAPSAGKAVSFAQDTVKAVAAKGFVLGKDAVVRAKAYGQSHQVPAAAIAKASQLSQGIGLTDKVTAGIEAAKSVDQRYHISGTTRSAAYVTQRAAASAANAVVSSSYFSKGALWLSGALDRASQVAADLGNRGAGKDS
ncbi:binding partner of ACD11 1-like isoform X2 [Salvia miltiorrhiza]|uniref:binding partner of ACD11 1-like isoform X2 n=1 Tax=Salvia miltiorrhiza TaxID=226208 RepID=UPI0025ACF9F2|nr:binding partner of ACD11 1-like isoform X2 [Salvia miltiorrhiza]